MNDVIELFKKGKSLREIERITGINRKLASKHLKSKGFKIRAKNGNSGYDKTLIYKEAEDLFNKGYSIRKISELLGVNRVSFSMFLQNKGYEIKSNRKKDKAFKDNLLYKKEMIVDLFNSGLNVSDIVKEMKVSRVFVSETLKQNNLNTNRYIMSKNLHAFKNIDTEEKAYWLGFMYADGYVGDNHIELALKLDDLLHLEKFKDFMQTDSTIIERKSKILDKTYSSCRISISSKEICDDLKNKGCYSNKSLILKYPNDDIVPKYLRGHFMRGYFDGDGSIGFNYQDKTPQVRFSVIGTKDFLHGFIEDFNLTKNKLSPEGLAYSYRLGGNIKALKVLDKIYENSTIHLDRKYNRYIEAKSIKMPSIGESR